MGSKWGAGKSGEDAERGHEEVMCCGFGMGRGEVGFAPDEAVLRVSRL